tara:strand:- start:2697 stop:3647 length:951 start_codon:yes stop_codon:yes gene_type:complete
MIKISPNNNNNNLAILMCTKNGEKYIKSQLDSIINQTFKNFDIYISDNNSSDMTLKEIKDFMLTNQNINISLLKGDDGHFSNNFINLAKSIKKKYAYYAFCDQDDVWLDFHLERGISCIKENDAEIPSISCSSTILIDQDSNVIGKSKVFMKAPSFENSLVQSIAGGNTMIFNYASYKFLKNLDTKKLKIPSHDWMIYQLVAGNKGNISYQKTPSVKYRQHSRNTIGSNKGFKSLIKRIFLVINGEWKKWIDINIAILQDSNALNRSSRKLVKDFIYFRKCKSPLKKIIILKKIGIYRQTIFGNLSLIFAALINKI